MLSNSLGKPGSTRVQAEKCCVVNVTECRAPAKPQPSTAQREKYCVFNVTRQSFLSFGVTVADTQWSRIRGLLGRRRLPADDGVWLVPCQGIHSIGLLFPIDVVYLDSDSRVIYLAEHYSPFRVGPLRRQSHSVLELPTRSIYWSNTQVGDKLLICPPAALSGLWSAGGSQATEGGRVMFSGDHGDPGERKPASRGYLPAWLKRAVSRLFDRRDAPRSAIPGLAAYYWEGGVPTSHEVMNISETGAYVRAATGWYPGTIIELTVQYEGSADDKSADSKLTVHLPCRVVRRGPDGFGVRFLFPDPAVRKEFRKLMGAVKAQSLKK